jgi:hypothetical protein
MIDKESPTDSRAGMNLNTGCSSNPVRIDARQQLKTASPQQVCDAVTPDGMYTWVGQRNLQSITRSRIALQRGIEIFNYALEHLSLHQILVKNC